MITEPGEVVPAGQLGEGHISFRLHRNQHIRAVLFGLNDHRLEFVERVGAVLPRKLVAGSKESSSSGSIEWKPVVRQDGVSKTGSSWKACLSSTSLTLWVSLFPHERHIAIFQRNGDRFVHLVDRGDTAFAIEDADDQLAPREGALESVSRSIPEQCPLPCISPHRAVIYYLRRQTWDDQERKAQQWLKLR